MTPDLPGAPLLAASCRLIRALHSGYGFGAAFQSTVTGMPLGITAASTLVFVPGDLIKIAVASLLALPVLASADSAR